MKRRKEDERVKINLKLFFSSSLSTGLNSMAAVVLEDFVKPFMKTPFTRKGADIFMKLTVVVLGTICVALVFVVEQAGTHVLQVNMKIFIDKCKLIFFSHLNECYSYP